MDDLLWTIDQGDCLPWFACQPADSIDLVFGSPPYEDARRYLEDGQDIGVARTADEWVAWMADVYQAALRCCRGLVAFVVAGRTRNFSWSASPVLLMAELVRRGITLRHPLIYHRCGIPGSGGPDWMRTDTEFVVCATRGGRLPWSDNTACGLPPKFPPGGTMSYRGPNDQRRRYRYGPADGEEQAYHPPALANPGNVIRGTVGGGQMGSKLAAKNEAPFPEWLADFMVRSFCPPTGIVCDPFSGSGTTAAVAVQTGRRFRGCDLRASQVALTKLRLTTVQRLLS